MTESRLPVRNFSSPSHSHATTIRRLVACAVVAGAAVAAAATPATAGAAPTDTDAGRTFNLFIPGTWETDASANPFRAIGALKPIADRIRRDHGSAATIYFLPYVARAFDNGESYGSSKATALDNAARVLRDHAERFPDAKFTISGYSQGADAAGDLAAAIGNHLGPIAADKVLGVALLADPRAGTPGETVIGPAADGVGIADPRPLGMGSLLGKVSSICATDDLYCSIDKDRNPFLGTLGTALSKAPEQAIGAVREAANAVSILTSIPFPRIIDGFASLPTLLAAGDLARAHTVSSTVNADLRPLVTLAASVDFTEVSTTLALIPDKTGLTRALSLLAAALAHVDIERAADLVGKIQELTWTATGSVAGRAGAKTLPTTTTTPAELTEIGRELASMSAGLVTASARTGNGIEIVAPDVAGLATSATSIMARYAITDPRTIVTDGLRAAQFYRSESHVRYGSLIVDGQGRNALDWLGDWLSTTISQAD
ncbi:cutinase family protein [Gordonia sp. ABSL11-1]|uniref:cutinase family protein n=1 Tax=Gordonia sp. ABSL11-1 TaxID=3053924 RepID=UPI0025740166|nr:cutinase family protein [Gordonia sp. ABSL11-1]MDL9944267.1 cutinase family protein [Gordonia sp. ABSL11-1]